MLSKRLKNVFLCRTLSSVSSLTNLWTRPRLSTLNVNLVPGWMSVVPQTDRRRATYCAADEKVDASQRDVCFIQSCHHLQQQIIPEPQLHQQPRPPNLIKSEMAEAAIVFMLSPSSQTHISPHFSILLLLLRRLWLNDRTFSSNHYFY